MSDGAAEFQLARNKTFAEGLRLGRNVMPEQKDQRANPLASERQEMPLASLKQIGNELRTKLTEIVGEPLPVEIQALLAKLEQMLDGKQ